ncbi:PP2C family serine/threonine-protein phosphatase [Pseudomonas syringae]|uniref:PP2C family serine/threonine-protein phosphatase n=1 Tax=Pseudomonas syringae TaxID=317 RepID=UPI0012B762B5|nr:PP2C family serine/threonine-protein phosphatase [Pseudomonas syringae]
MWECASAVSIGTAHTERGGRCEDRCSSQVFDQAGAPWVALFVSDGAGSAECGEQGADIAVRTANETVSQLMELAELPLDESLALQIVNDIRQAISQAADQSHLPIRAYACTFLGALTSSAGTLVFQIGDGGIVLDGQHGLELAIEPMNGDYANETLFICQKDAIERLAVRVYPAGVTALALFSDGLQRLALDMAKCEPHGPFFEPIFRKMQSLTDVSRPQIGAALESFLGSSRINDRTDDDKSLAIAVLRV